MTGLDDAGRGPGAQAPADDQATLLKTVREEFTAITPGEGSSPPR